MAIFGLQSPFMNQILREYFGIIQPNIETKEMFLGLGLTQHGADINLESFREVNNGRPWGGYKRARIVFGKAANEVISNVNEIVFSVATENWTVGNDRIEMLGIFNTQEYEIEDSGTKKAELVRPLIVLRLPRFETLLKTETIVLKPNAVQLSLRDM